MVELHDTRAGSACFVEQLLLAPVAVSVLEFSSAVMLDMVESGRAKRP
jgi:hypothetical protein